MSRAYLDIHILQTLPPANINRDDTGSPKTAVYGGVRRARVSSQSWKRATRLAFRDLLPPSELSTRTRRTVGLLAERLQTALPGITDIEAGELARGAFGALGLSTATKKGADTTTGEYLLFIGNTQLDELVRRISDNYSDLPNGKGRDEALKGLGLADVIRQAQPADVALFGRMVADVPALNVDAACQVAHALSTHAVDTEFDYFTAVDDELTDEESGAGMIGTVEFASSTLYRYATLDIVRLAENIGGNDEHVAAVARSFADGFIRSMPAGKQTTFGHRTLPDVVLLAVRDDQPVNLVGAFETPVPAGQMGFVAASADALARRAAAVHEVYGAPQAIAVSCLPDYAAAVTGLGVSVPLTAAIEDALAGALSALQASRLEQELDVVAAVGARR